MASKTGNLKKLLREAGRGDQAAAAVDHAIPLIYQRLRRLAGSYLRNKQFNNSLQPTALVHEAYLRLVDRSQSDWQDQAHFFHLAATIMRQVLVDHAGTRLAAKRGGNYTRIEFNEELAYSDSRALSLVALDDALKALAAVDERKAKALELRYFGGLNVEETAQVLGTSAATVGRDTRYAEAWLRRQLRCSELPSDII